MSTNWESLSKQQKRLAFVTVILEASNKFENDTVDDCLESLYKFCVDYSKNNNIRLSIPFPTEEETNK